MTQRPHVLFVDDEPRLLGGIRRMLRTHRDRWDMSFAESGEVALATMREKPCDVIVSDYRMPGMDGGQLLERVRNDYPCTARVILSGQTNEENLLGIMVLAHEFLTKPSSPEQLVATVERLINVRWTPQGEPPRHQLVRFESLPSAPHALIDLMEALNADNASAQSVGSVIARDPATAATVLKLVNSSAYTPGRTISNVGQAVTLLGLDMVRSLVVMHDLVDTFDTGGRLPAEWIYEITQHSVDTSCVARLLAAGREWESQAFAAGLLHEVGQLALAASQPAEFSEVLETWRRSGEGSPADAACLSSVETAVFGVSHIEAGEDLLGLWGLPPQVIEAVAQHATTVTDVSPATDVSSAVALAHLVVEASMGPVCGPRTDATTLDEGLLSSSDREIINRWRSERSRSPR